MGKIKDIPRDMHLIETIRRPVTPHVETEDGFVKIADPADEFAPPFQNSWANYSATQSPPAGFYLSKDGELRMRGLVTDGAVDTVIFTLPESFRPQFTKYFDADSDIADVYSLNSVRFRTHGSDD